jgi:hypothetical protein
VEGDERLDDVARLLGRSLTGRVRGDARQIDLPGCEFDEHECVQPPRSHKEERNYLLLDLDGDERTSEHTLALANAAGVVTTLRTEAPEPDTNIQVMLPT